MIFDEQLDNLKPLSVSRRVMIKTTLGAVASSHISSRLLRAQETHASMREDAVPLKQIKAGVLNVAFRDSGPSAGKPVVLLHGFPYDVHCYDQVEKQLASSGLRVLVPYLRGYGPTRFLSSATPRVGQQAALASDLLAFMDTLNLKKATLAGFDWGGRAACVVAAMHPERVDGLLSCGVGYNIQNSDEALKPVAPESEQHHWYWFYLNSQRGADAILHERFTLCRYLWKNFSPSWNFTDETYEKTASAFENPDFTAVVLHSYRYRIGAVPGDPALDGMERKLSKSPKVEIPTIVIEGADDGVDPPGRPEEVAPHFSSLRRLTVLPGIGHNVPQEAPVAFADALSELTS